MKGRPLLLIRSLEKDKAGYEAIRVLKREMEPKERARSLAIVKQLAAWQFKEGVGLHEQLVAYEEALRNYEAGLKEPLRSQIQLRMRANTRYSEIRECILQCENVSAPWSSSLQKGGGQGNGGPHPLDVDQVEAWKGKSGKSGKKGKDKKGKDKKGKQQPWHSGKQQQWHGGKQQQQWQTGKGSKGKHQYGWGKGKGSDNSQSGKGYGSNWDFQKRKKAKGMALAVFVANTAIGRMSAQ